MKVLQCDTCRVVIDQESASYFGADHFAGPVPVDPADPDGETWTPLHALGETEFHFCSPACLAEWAFARSIEHAPPG